jgi:hypothetical protein
MLRFGTMLAVVAALGLPSSGFGQGLGPDELTRQVNPGVAPPEQGAGHFERYNLNRYMIPYYLNFNARQFYYLEYEDRLDRGAKFGDRWPSAKYGPEFQLRRIENDYERRVEQIEAHPARRGWFSGGVFFGRLRR